MKVLNLFRIKNLLQNMSHYMSTILTIWIVITFIPGCCVRRLTHERLQGVLWMQTSGEYAAVVLQTFKLARFRLEEALNDSNWTAEIEQQSQEYSYLPPAIVVDIDESILNNTPFQARIIKNNKDFDSQMWRDWVREAKASAIPGAVQFLQYAHTSSL